MTFSIESWIPLYLEAVKQQFGSRIWFVGLQGSYARQEATDQSDIDLVLILDKVTADDLITYSQLLDTLPHREKLCGFTAGREELTAWEPSDLFQLCQDTIPLVGSLKPILDGISRQDVYRAIHTGVCNIYHICGHNLIHGKKLSTLKGCYKIACFNLQAIAYVQTGQYQRQKTTLLPLLQPEDSTILQTAISLKKQETISPAKLTQLSEQLLDWASGWMKQCAEVKET